MAGEKINFIKEAFKRQENVITLAGLGIAGVVFSSGFLFLGAALEISYLWLVSTNPRFQRVVRAEKNQALLRSSQAEREALLATLPVSDKIRYSALGSVRQKIYDSWKTRDDVTQSLLEPSVEKVDYLLGMFLRAQVTLNRLQAHLRDSGKPQIERQLKTMEQELKLPMPDKLRDVKAKNLEILRQRLARLGKLDEDMAVVDTQLNTLENAIKFMGDQTVALADPKQISEQVDRLVSDVQDTEKSISDVEVFLDAQNELKSKSDMEMRNRLGENA